ncbi:hypothetical protein H6G06_12200 [Anabaena sphaerica FACHB-251]|uniref:Uncharacterized protein n=1 Tax=Anabaena sphaerica FACHB-251 TaxID=2692883 RepID=A0A926WGM7_9NOST|nr:hypothetical protein [Anabaena sphaerica]MBD2294234.1 hypothetical protein [Anabaena sphaerica FACHB-251]
MTFLICGSTSERITLLSEIPDSGEAKVWRSKGIYLDTPSESIIVKVSTAKAAFWACNTVSEMVNAILDKLPASFTDNNPHIDLYRREFQLPEK